MIDIYNNFYVIVWFFCLVGFIYLFVSFSFLVVVGWFFLVFCFCWGFCVIGFLWGGGGLCVGVGVCGCARVRA